MTPQEKAAATRQQHKAARDRKRAEQKAELEHIKKGLLSVLDNEAATPAEKLEASRLLLNIES